MKIEKINDNQIRCTLTHEDLAKRQLQLSELAYGTEKAKSLFHDMMQQAAHEFGFEADDIPLMIEAIPSSSGSIVLIITKVEDPEELDTRFSKFAPSKLGDSDNKNYEALDKLEGADTLLNLLGKVKEKMDEASKKEDKNISDTTETEKEDKTSSLKHSIRLFSFSTMDQVLKASRLLGKIYHGSNSLYKDTAQNIYLLALMQSDHSTNDYNRICNMLTEYGTLEKASNAALAFLKEHCEVLVAEDAIQQLSQI